MFANVSLDDSEPVTAAAQHKTQNPDNEFIFHFGSPSVNQVLPAVLLKAPDTFLAPTIGVKLRSVEVRIFYLNDSNDHSNIHCKFSH